MTRSRKETIGDGRVVRQTGHQPTIQVGILLMRCRIHRVVTLASFITTQSSGKISPECVVVRIWPFYPSSIKATSLVASRVSSGLPQCRRVRRGAPDLDRKTINLITFHGQAR
jgi:hypothetical protein